MNKDDIVKLVKPYEPKRSVHALDNPKLGKLWDILYDKVVAGEITLEALEEAIGDGSEAYPSGFPGLYNLFPDFTSQVETALLRDKGFPAFGC